MSQALAERKDKLPVEATEPVNLLAAIIRAASNPSVDVDKMERLMTMQERLEVRQAKASYTQAVVAVKPRLPVIERNGKIVIPDKNDKTKIIQSTPYALWEDIDEAITPILHDHGLVLTFRTGSTADGKVTVTAVLNHVEGHSEESGPIALPMDTSGSKNNVQGVGSALSYGKRYSAMMVLNIRTKGLDDDGKRAGDPEPLGDEEIAKIFDLLKRTDSDQEKFCKFMGVSIVADITRKDYPKALEILHTKLDAKERGPKK